MAKSVLTHLDFHGVAQLKNALFDIKASSAIPSAGVTGQFLYNSTTNKFGYWNGTEWVYPGDYSLPTATASVLGGVKVGSTLAISSGVLNQKSGIATAGTYRSVTVDTYGRVTGGTNPTTLSDYGITDAKIESGVITLGLVTITPATTAMLNNAVPNNMTTAGHVLLSTGTGGTSAWSAWTTKGILQTSNTGVVSVKTPTLWGVMFTGDNVTTAPNLYIGTTKVQASSAAQHVTGVTSLTIGDAVLSWDSTNKALKLTKRDGTSSDIGFWAEGFVSAFGPSATEGGGGSDITAEDIISILNAYTPGMKIKGDVLNVAGGGGLSWTDLENATSTSHVIDNSHLSSSITGLVSKVSALESSAATSVTTTGSGNAITSVSKSGNNITFTKGSSFPVLDNGKIPMSYLPDAILGQVIYGGTLGANALATLTANAKAKLGTTSSTLTLSTGSTGTGGYVKNEGIYYIASANQTFGTISLLVGDWLLSTGSGWTKIDNTDAVTGVKGNAESSYRIGNINITPANIGKATTSALGCVQIGSGLSVDANGVVSIGSFSKSHISDFPTSMPASDVYSWAKASTKPSYTLDEVSDGSARKLTKLYTYTIPANKGVRITYTQNSGTIIFATRNNSDGRLVLVGSGYGAGGNIRNDWLELIHGNKFTWGLPNNDSISCSVEIIGTKDGADYIKVISSGEITFTPIDTLTSPRTRISYDTTNANLSTVDWAAKNLSVAGTLDVAGNASVKLLYVKGTANSSGYISADSATNMFVHIGDKTMLVVDSSTNCLRPGSSNTDAKLGTSLYPWNTLYSTTINNSGNATIDGTLSVTGAATFNSTLKANSLTYTHGYTANISASGWYRCYISSGTGGSGHSLILNIDRQFQNTSNESYTFAINVAYTGNCNFTQISGHANTQLIKKIRYDNGANAVDIYVDTNQLNGYYVYGSGLGTFQAPTLVSAPTGTTKEFDVQATGMHVSEGILSDSYIRATGNITGYYSSSDLRLKKNFTDLNLGLDAVANLPLKSYDRTDCGDKRTDGTIAQEIQKLLPNEVYDRGDGYLAMAEGQIGLIFSINAHKEILRLRKRVEELERRLD